MIDSPPASGGCSSRRSCSAARCSRANGPADSGDFKHIPPCASATATGCVIAYSSFDTVPPAHARFGRTASTDDARPLRQPRRSRVEREPRRSRRSSRPIAFSFLGGAGSAAEGLDAVGLLPRPLHRAVQALRHRELAPDRRTRARPATRGPLVRPMFGPGWGLHGTDVNIALANLVAVVGNAGAGVPQERLTARVRHTCPPPYAVSLACDSREGYPRVRPVEAARGSCRAHARDAHAISGRLGGVRRHPSRGPSSRSMGRRALPPARRRLRRLAEARLGAPPRARRRDRRDGRRAERALVRVEGALRAHARARARPLREAAAPRLRHRAAPPPGGRARRDAHRADRGGREAERRTATATATNGSVAAEDLVEEEEEDEDDIPVELDDDGEPDDLPPPPHEDPGAERRYRFRHPTASGKTIAAAGFVEAARTEGVLILTHRRLLVDQFRRELTDHGYGERLTDVILTGHDDRSARTRSRSRPTPGSPATSTRSRARPTSS